MRRNINLKKRITKTIFQFVDTKLNQKLQKKSPLSNYFNGW